MTEDPVVARFDREWRKGDRELARKIAKEYIADRREELAPLLANLTVNEMVALIEGYRAKGDESSRTVADMWLLTQPSRASGAPLKVTEAPALMCNHDECGALLIEFDEYKGKDLASIYVNRHLTDLQPLLEPKSLPELVGMIDFYRELDKHWDRIIVDAWLVVKYPPQDIVGQIHLSRHGVTGLIDGNKS